MVNRVSLASDNGFGSDHAMHQSFVTTSLSGPGYSKDIDFFLSKALRGHSYDQSSAKSPALIPAGKCKFA